MPGVGVGWGGRRDRRETERRPTLAVSRGACPQKVKGCPEERNKKHRGPAPWLCGLSKGQKNVGRVPTEGSRFSCPRTRNCTKDAW